MAPRATTPSASGLVRINRYLSMCGVTSRRKAESIVLERRVAVNGATVVDLATMINPATDRVTLDRKQLRPAQTFVYLVLNKPKDTITTVSDERGRRTVMSLVQSRHRVYPVGRLDRNTTGVLLFTNDGAFAHNLMHPRFAIPKVYHVTCDRPVALAHLQQLRNGMVLDDGKTAPTNVAVLPEGKGARIAIALREGRNRQVRRMLEGLGYDVLKLDRVAYGPVTKEGLARGEVRSLTRNEVRKLKDLAGIDELL